MTDDDDSTMDLDSSMAGGPTGYYNPAFGVMAIQNPEMFVQHLASKGIQPPADFDEDFTHQDAHAILASNTASPGASLKDQSQLPTSFSDRFGAAFPGGGTPDSAMAFAPQGKDPAIPEADIEPWKAPPPPSAAAPPPPPNPEPTRDVPAPKARPVGSALKGPENDEPWGGRPHVDPEPLPPTDAPSTAGGAAVPAGTSQEQPGNLNQKEPSAKNPSVDQTKKSSREGSQDAFGKALAGISAMKAPPVIFPHPGNIPHPSNQISRGTLPTELLKELSNIARPENKIRLGMVLKGR